MSSLLTPVIAVFSCIGMMVCLKIYNDKVKSIIVSHDQIQIDFKLLKSRIDNLEQSEQSTETQPYSVINDNLFKELIKNKTNR